MLWMDARTQTGTHGRTTLKQYTHRKQSLRGYKEEPIKNEGARVVTRFSPL